MATNVQFEEIRDEALKALSNLTKALGSTYQEDSTEEEKDNADAMAEEATRVEAEQKRIREEREAAERLAEEMRKKEYEERKKFKEAMDAQRELDKIEQENARKAKEEEQKKLEQERRSTNPGGKCQGKGEIKRIPINPVSAAILVLTCSFLFATVARRLRSQEV